MSEHTDRRDAVVLVTLILLILILLVWIKSAHASTWTWNESPGAETYTLYWSECPTCFHPARSVDTATLEADDGGVTPAPGHVIYYVVTATNAAGESPTEHGRVWECCP